MTGPGGGARAKAPVRAGRGGLGDLLAHALAVKAVFTDLDGTFLDAGHRLPGRAPAVVDRLQATGVRFVPATGRTLPALRGIFGPLLDRIDAVAGNGADVVVGGRCVFHAPYPLDDARALLRAIADSGLRLGFAVFRTDGTLYLLDREADFARTHIESLAHAEVRPFGEGIAEDEVAKVAVVACDGADEAARFLAAGPLGGRFDFAPCGPHWIDVLVKGLDKVDGVRRVLACLGVAPNEALAFGDSMNDLKTMEALPLSVAVSNAMPALKKRCAFEIGSDAEGAVLDCLERVAELRERAGMR